MTVYLSPEISILSWGDPSGDKYTVMGGPVMVGTRAEQDRGGESGNTMGRFLL